MQSLLNILLLQVVQAGVETEARAAGAMAAAAAAQVDFVQIRLF
jgi:hypothetical protein